MNHCFRPLQDSKRQSYASTASSGTMGSAEGDSRESRLHQSQPDPTIPGKFALVRSLRLFDAYYQDKILLRCYPAVEFHPA